MDGCVTVAYDRGRRGIFEHWKMPLLQVCKIADEAGGVAGELEMWYYRGSEFLVC